MMPVAESISLIVHTLKININKSESSAASWNSFDKQQWAMRKVLSYTQ